MTFQEIQKEFYDLAHGDQDPKQVADFYINSPLMLKQEVDEYYKATDSVDELDALVDIVYECCAIANARGFYLEGGSTLSDLMWDVQNPQAKAQANAVRMLYNTSIEYAYDNGYDFSRAFHLVHAANMAKAVNGRLIRSDEGKIIKPEGWKAPDLSGCV